METAPHWKRVWRAVTGRSVKTSTAVVEDALKLARKHILEGITMYPRFTEDSFTKCSVKVELKEHPDLSKFIRQLSIALDLDACMTWSVFCSYLMFEYYGKIEDMLSVLNNNRTGENFVNKIWQFYTLERTYLLRIFWYIIENYGNTSNKFHQQYANFIESITMKRIRELLFKQFSYLTNEIPEEYSNPAIDINDLVERNNAELLQTLMIILATIKYEKFEIPEFLKMFTLFKEHTFSPSCEQQQILKLSRNQVFENLLSAELAIFVASLENFWYNQDKWYSAIDEIEKMVKEIFDGEKVSIILLTWAALQSTLPTDLAKLIYEQHSRVYVSRALERYVFKDLFKVVSNPIFKGSTAGLVAKAAFYKVFDVLCIKYDAQQVYMHEGTVALFGEFLRTPELACAWKNMDGISLFFLNAVTVFPFHFEALTHFMESFISIKIDTESVLHELCNLKTYTEIYLSPDKFGPHIKNDVLLRTYKPIDNDDIVFEAGNSAPIIDKFRETLVELHGEWNYFKLFTTVVKDFLNDAQNRQDYADLVQQIVVSGYKLILELLKVRPDLAWDNDDIRKLIQLALCLLSISTKVHTRNLQLMKICFEITIHIFKRDPADIVRALIAIDFLPKIANEDDMSPEIFERTYLLSDSTLLRNIEDEFSYFRSCDLLLLYIELVNEAMKMNIYYKKLQIPACMFLLVKVFPIFIKQFSTENLIIRKVLVDIVKIIHTILKMKENPANEVDLILYKCVMELFLQNVVCAVSFLKILECGNIKLELLLTTEMNWESGEHLAIVDTVERALECLLLMLNHVKLNGARQYLPFTDLLYWWEPPRVSTLKVVSSYINHCFNSNIPKLACNILTAFVKISNNSLLHSLQLDNYQLQSIFLERLRDSLDDQNLRVDIVRLVTACINEQSSMTLGFFNINPKGENLDGSILSFLAEYLKNVEKNPNCLLIPLQGAIVDLFHELWKNNKQHLLMTVTNPESFWASLITPLLKPDDVPLEILLQILEIVILELHFCKANIKEKFNKEFRAIFELPKRFLNIWMDRLVEVSQDETVLSDSSGLSISVAFLTIWKNLMLTVKLLNPDYFEHKWNKSFFLERCLSGLMQYSEQPNQIEILTLWGELVLLFVNFPVMENDAVKENVFNYLTQILKNISILYERLTDTCRTVLLTDITIVLTNFVEFLATNPDFILPFLKPLERIFYLEYKVTFVQKLRNEEHYRNWILIIRIIRTFLKFETVSDCEYFFIHVRFVERMIEVLGLCLLHSYPPKLSQITAISLVEFAESPWIRHFEMLDLHLLTEQLLPPKTLILQTNRFPNGIIPQHLKDWWILYMHIIRLNCTLLRRRKGYMSQYGLDFMFIHQAVIADALISATVVADVTNLELVIEVLRFIYALFEYRRLWTAYDASSFFCILRTIKQVLNASIGVILRPKSLIFVPNNPQSVKIQVQTVVPHQSLLNIINSYVDIITWCCKCFTRSNPPLDNLFNIFQPSDFKVFVVCDFRVPTVMEEDDTLTYGGLLCALHFVTKALNQVFFHEKEKSNDLTPKGDKPSVTTPSSPLTPTPSSEMPASKGDDDPYFNVIILPLYAKETAESITVLHSFTVPDIMGLQSAWLANLNADSLIMALNSLIMFLAGQTFITLRDVTIERNLKRYVKRELCSELSLYYDFVIKYLVDKYSPTDDEQSAMMGTDTRVMATPRRTHTKSRFRTRDKTSLKIGTDCKLTVDIMRICSDRPLGRKTEMVDLEDCYLLTSVHWFRHVCSLVHYSKFDEFLSRWHAKSTYVMPHSTFVKNTSVHLSDEEDELNKYL